MGRVTIQRRQEERVPKWAVPGAIATPGVSPNGKPEYEQGAVLPDPDPLPPPPRRDWQNVRQPELFRGLDIDYRGFPVPYTLHPGRMPADKKIDFRVLNGMRHERCARLRLCAVCGKELPKELYYIGGPMCVQNRIFGDGPLHEECARYSMQVCPYLAIGPKIYSERPNQAPALYGKTTHDPNLIKQKPERIIIYVCTQYRLISGGGGKPVYVVEPARRVEWYTVDGNYLCTTRPDRYAQ